MADRSSCQPPPFHLDTLREQSTDDFGTRDDPVETVTYAEFVNRLNELARQTDGDALIVHVAFRCITGIGMPC